MELSEQEKEIAQKLISPDSEKEYYYDHSQEVQQRILGCLLTDKYFLLQSLNLIKPFYFKDKAHQRICKILFEFYNKYGAQPDRSLLENELIEQLGDNPARHYYLAELETVCESYEPGLQKREYLLNKITEFAKTQALRTAYSKTLDILFKNGNEKWSKIRDILQEALLVERNVDIGLDYFKTLEERYEKLQQQIENKDFFTSGFPSLDMALGGGLGRGEIASWCGMSGSGKSLALAKGAIANLQLDRKVLYLSLEMDEYKTANRFDALLTNTPIQALIQERKEVIKNLKNFNKFHATPNSLYVKQFPAGTANVVTIRAYLSQLTLHGFQPDLIIVDYVGELDHSGGNKLYEERQRLVTQLRGLAVELNVCMLTAMQVGRAGRLAMESGNVIDDDSLADSAGQVRPLDALWSINQNKTEIAANVGNIFVIKHRNGKSRFKIYFERNPLTLDMHEISKEAYHAKLSTVMELYAKDTGTDLATKVTMWKPNSDNVPNFDN
jgi:replicative DNA helicase